MTIEDDSDDEIAFKTNTVSEEVVPNEHLDDTLPYNPSPRQQDECQELQNPQGDNPNVDNWADYGDYPTYEAPDQFDHTFYAINENWTDDTDVKIAYEGASRQVDRDKTEYNDRYVTHIQDGYTTVQIEPETCEMDIGLVPNSQAQQVYTAYHELDFYRATETHPDWAPTPVKVLGPEPEPRELFFHEQVLEISNRNRCLVKSEPPSITSTPKKKVISQSEEDIYPLHTPKSESRATAKLANMFVEDLPQGDQNAPTNFTDPSAVNMFSMRFTEAAAATNYDLYVPNNRQANNNNTNRG